MILYMKSSPQNDELAFSNFVKFMSIVFALAKKKEGSVPLQSDIRIKF